MLSRIAREFAAEIANHDWSDAPWRMDRAGHQRESDTNRGDRVLSAKEADAVRTNVMWVTAQVLLHADPNLDLHEFATACGVPRRFTHRSNGSPSGSIPAGIRLDPMGRPFAPGLTEVPRSEGRAVTLHRGVQGERTEPLGLYAEDRDILADAWRVLEHHGMGFTPYLTEHHGWGGGDLYCLGISEHDEAVIRGLLDRAAIDVWDDEED